MALWAGVLSALLSFVCPAEDYLLEDGGSYFELQPYELEMIREDVSEICGTTEKYRSDSVFLSGSELIAGPESSESMLVYSQVYDEALDCSQKDGFICLLIDRQLEEEPLSLTVRYAANGEKITFESAVGALYQAAYLDCAKITAADGNDRILQLKLTQEDLEKLSYYYNAETGNFVLRFAPTAVVIQSVSVALKNGEYAYVRAMHRELSYRSPVLSATYWTVAGKNSGVEYRLEDKNVGVASENVTSLTVTDWTGGCYENSVSGGVSDRELQTAVSYEYPEASGAETESEDVIAENVSAENGETLDGESEETESGLSAEELLQMDIEERFYCGLTEGGASTVYTDSFLFVRDGEMNACAYSAGIYGKDLLINVYGVESDVGNTQPEETEADDLIGMVFSTEQLPEASVSLQVASLPESSYAGELTVRFRGEAVVASPSDAVRPKNNTADTYTFAKTSGEVFTASAGTVQMTEAFLKKASYCALNDEDVVIAVYNTHGRLLTLAEGCTEEDVASYILLPGTAEGSSFGEISITRNECLSPEREYAALHYMGTGGSSAAPAAVLSGYCDAEAEAGLSFTLDFSGGSFTFNSCTILNLTAEATEGWTLKNVPSEEVIPEEEETVEEDALTEENSAETDTIEDEAVENAADTTDELTPGDGPEQPAEEETEAETQVETQANAPEEATEQESQPEEDAVGSEDETESSKEQEPDPIGPVEDHSVEETAEGGAIVTDATHDFEKLIKEGADEASINGTEEVPENEKETVTDTEVSREPESAADGAFAEESFAETDEFSMAEAIEEMVQLENLEEIVQENASEEVIVL